MPLNWKSLKLAYQVKGEVTKSIQYTTRSGKPHSSVGSVQDLRTGGRWVDPWLGQYSIPRIDDSHCDRIHSYHTAVDDFHNGYVGKQPLAWKEYFAGNWLKELQESMDKCTGHRNITEIHVLLKTALNTIQSINQSINQSFSTEKF